MVFSLALVLIGTAVGLAILCPRMLAGGRWQLLYPRIALTIWFGLFGLGATMALYGLALGSVAAESLGHANPHALGVTISAAIWVAIGVFVVVLMLFPTLTGSLQALHPEVNAQAVPYEYIGFTLMRFHSSTPEAYALPGRRPKIFVSSALEQLLSESQLQAVLAHEFAHLRHHHGLAIRIAQINALCLPGTRASSGFERVTRLQTELAADDAAARQIGAANLASALIVLSEVTQNIGMRLRAERLAQKRWPAASRRRAPNALRALPQGL